MILPDIRIVRFLKKHHVLTICTTVDDEPWCANCFYVYMEEDNAFVFTTDNTTRHGREFSANSRVAGSVVLETRIIGKIQGVQFQGTVSVAEGERLKRAEKAYVKRFPVAALMDTHLWIVDISLLKMTDNLLGFGKKLLWEE